MPPQFSDIQGFLFPQDDFRLFEIFFFLFYEYDFFFFFFTDAISSLIIDSWIFIRHTDTIRKSSNIASARLGYINS